MLGPQTPGIPVPSPSWRLRPYWDGCREGRLLYWRCGSCGNAAVRPFTVCSGCGGPEGGWTESAGRGSLYSWTVVWRPQHPSFSIPYAPAVVQVDEGYFMMSAVVGCEPEELKAGMRLAVEFHPASDDIVLPYFAPERS